MKLNKKEKQVLTILDSAKVNGVEELVQKFVWLPKDRIQKIVEKLEKLGLIDIIILPNDNQSYYFHDTRKIKPDMLDDDIRFKRDYGSDSHLLNDSRNLKRIKS